MGELDSRYGSLFLDKGGNAFEGLSLVIRPYPAIPGEIRPSGETAVASTMTSEAPPTARLPKWTKCQSVGIPSLLEYWHMGETKIRFLNSSPLSLRGENNKFK